MVQVSPSELLSKAWFCDYIAVDTEGTDIHKTDLRAGTGFAYGVSVACRPVTREPIYSAYFPVAHTRDNVDDKTRDGLKALVENHERVVFHNAKHDILALPTVDIVRNTKFYDTMLMAHWLFEEYTWSGFSLQWCCEFFLKNEGKARSELFKALLTLFGWSPDFPQEEMGIYAAVDTERTLQLFEYLYPIFKRQGFDG